MAPERKTSPRRKRGGRKKRGRGGSPPPGLASHPTSRNAMVNTRTWPLDEDGPYCAYCGIKPAAPSMTLHHGAPRRGQMADDRRATLVLACRSCNALKRDMAPLA